NFEDPDVSKRYGAQHDYELLKTATDKFGIELCYKPDPENIENEINQFIEDKIKNKNSDVKRKNIDALILIIGSHGSAQHVKDKEGINISKNDIKTLLNNKGCSELKGVPKIIIFNSCSGKSDGAYGDSIRKRNSSTFEEIIEDNIDSHVKKDIIKRYIKEH